MRKSLIGALLVGVALFVSACAPTDSSRAADIDVTDGWVRFSEYSSQIGGMTGAFASFTNNTDHDITIVGGTAEIATMVEAHEVAMVDGEMKMRAVDGGIVIKAGEKVSLEPGGLHIMLMGLNQPILEGDEVTLTIDFDGTEDLTFTWPVKASVAGDETYAPKNN